MSQSRWRAEALAVTLLAASWGGCATSTATSPISPSLAPSLAQQTIRDADAAGAGRAGKPAELLAEAKSELTYAQHLSGAPEHAARLYERAQIDAELSLVLSRRAAQAHGSHARASLASSGTTP
jgi:hypothetical protein